MHCVVHCVDHPNSLQLRKDALQEHVAYLNSVKTKIVVAGPLMSKDGLMMIGSMFILDVNNLDEAIEFNKNDPFNKSGVWQRVDVNSFRVDINNWK